MNTSVGTILTLSIVILPFYTNYTFRIIRSHIHDTLSKAASILYYFYYILAVIGISTSSNLIPSPLFQTVAIAAIFIVYLVPALLFLTFFMSMLDAYRDSVKYSFTFGQYGVACTILLIIYTSPIYFWISIYFSSSPIFLIINDFTKTPLISNLLFMISVPTFLTAPLALLTILIFIHYHHWYRKSIETVKIKSNIKILSSPSYFKKIYGHTLISTDYNYKIWARTTWKRIIDSLFR